MPGLTVADKNAFKIAAYMRIASIAIAAYDYLETQPTAWRFYREHWQSRRLTISIILFALLRFTSITVLAISSVGFFYTHFTPESCAKFYLLAPSFKVIQVMVTQAILGIRTFNLSRRSKRVGWFLLALYTTACVMQWIVTIYQRKPKVGDIEANCRGINNALKLGAYIFYAIAMAYDVITIMISVWYLLKYQLISSSSMVMRLSRLMIYDGLGYLVALTGVNILNLILYRTSHDIQTAASSLGYALSWIMSQRLLIHLYDVSREHRAEDDTDSALQPSKDPSNPNGRGNNYIPRPTTIESRNNSGRKFDLSQQVATSIRASSSGTAARPRTADMDTNDRNVSNTAAERAVWHTQTSYSWDDYELQEHSQRSTQLPHHRQ